MSVNIQVGLNIYLNKVVNDSYCQVHLYRDMIAIKYTERKDEVKLAKPGVPKCDNVVLHIAKMSSLQTMDDRASTEYQDYDSSH